MSFSKKEERLLKLWIKCPATGEVIFHKILRRNLMVSPNSNYHFFMNAKDRINSLVDNESFKEFDCNLQSADFLKFKAINSYSNRLKHYQKKTGLLSAVVSGIGILDGIKISLVVMDFRFLGASMGSVVGEKITRAVERGIEGNIPVVIISASGGACMYEGIMSLMQMAKTCSAISELSKKKIPYISVLTNPTMAGVMASFASLGDFILAEPHALIGFAGQRVIKETIQRKKLPDGFQTSEFLLKNGLIDQIIDRREMRNRIIEILKFVYKKSSN